MNQRQVNIFSSKIKFKRFITNKNVPKKNNSGHFLGQRKMISEDKGLSRRNEKYQK